MSNSDIGKKKKGTKHRRISDYNSYDHFSYYRKQGGRLTRPQFNYVIDQMHAMYADNISRGIVVKLPANLGRLILEGKRRGMYIVDGKIRNNYCIDWGKTRKLWEEDEEARNNKTLVKKIDDSSAAVRWDIKHRFFKNRVAYRFAPVRSLTIMANENKANNLAGVPLQRAKFKFL